MALMASLALVWCVSLLDVRKQVRGYEANIEARCSLGLCYTALYTEHQQHEASGGRCSPWESEFFYEKGTYQDMICAGCNLG